MNEPLTSYIIKTNPKLMILFTLLSYGLYAQNTPFQLDVLDLVTALAFCLRFLLALHWPGLLW